MNQVQTKRAHNFAAGPAMLPEPVLRKIADEFLSYHGLGYSIAETSHRSKVFAEVLESAKQGLKKLMNLDDSYHIIFLQGGATTDFYRIPLNLLYKKDHTADYIVTGNWARKAYTAAQQVHTVHLAGSSEDERFSYIPEGTQLQFEPTSRYVYLCSNNTIFGTQFQNYPETNGIPLIGDFTSDIFSREVDYSRFSMIIAAAQKNLGPAGCSVIAIKDTLLEQCNPETLPIYSYKKLVAANSLMNTPPVFVIYVIDEVLKWMEAEGGTSVLEKRNRAKAKLLYDCIDNSQMYTPVAKKAYRSIMNVTWTLPSEPLTQQFIQEAETHNIVAIKGHVSAGGIRASIYNAMGLENVEKLADFMVQFEKTH